VRWHTLLIELGYAAGALLLALLVIVPVFLVVNFVYDDGDGISPLMLVVVAGWGTLAWLLRRRRIHL
jgi:hypothetical protein